MECQLVHIGQWKDKTVTISQKINSLTISIETTNETLVFSFDKSGRLWTALVKKISYRRGLNGSIVAKWSSGREVLHRKWLDLPEQEWLLNLSHNTIQSLLNDTNFSFTVFSPPIHTSTIQELSKLSEITQKFYLNDVSNYHSVYKPVGILPPDQYISVVLQLTEGCSFNKCTFCTFYKERPFIIKSPNEFEQHIMDVKKFLGNGLSLRRTIFLGDANALVVPMNKIIPLMEIIHNHLDVEKLGGIFAFLDGFSGERKSIGDYQKLRDLGLNKIYIGLESGNNQLLKFLNKPGSALDALNAVRTIKSSGISVGIIVLLGAGGKQYGENHITDTIEIINQMGLDADDLVYFSELIESEGLEYSQKAFSENLEPLSGVERQEQRKRIEEQLLFSDFGTPHISTYDIRDFVY
ncbi:MAG: radical SAM protein [Chloroflexi bacterium HGW-Chloroflexi-3]|nr:MAG: radical SAM protein [Chloroflexi bacterium HGW-Chloroflexi-3]